MKSTAVCTQSAVSATQRDVKELVVQLNCGKEIYFCLEQLTCIKKKCTYCMCNEYLSTLEGAFFKKNVYINASPQFCVTYLHTHVMLVVFIHLFTGEQVFTVASASLQSFAAVSCNFVRRVFITSPSLALRRTQPLTTGKHTWANCILG